MKSCLLVLIVLILIQSTIGYLIPKVAIKVLKPTGLQLSLMQGLRNNTKFVETAMTKDENGAWLYEELNVQLNGNDSFEYWLFVENNNLGYVTNELDSYKAITEASAVAACEKSISTVNGKVVCKNTLIFNEEFNMEILKLWNYDTRFSSDLGDAAFSVYEKRPETSYIRDGKLTIKPELMTRFIDFDDARLRRGNYKLKENCTPLSSELYECERHASFGGYVLPPVSSAFLTTKNKFSFMFGKVEIRAKLPVGSYIYPQLLLQPAISTNINTTEHLKIAFIRANEELLFDGEDVGGRRLYGGAILSKNANNNNKWMKNKLTTTHLGKDFHLYELKWTPNEIVLSLDGQVYGTININLRTSALKSNIKKASQWNADNLLAPFDKEHFIAIGVSVGGGKYFHDSVLDGITKMKKPWKNSDPRGERLFYINRDSWYSTWNSPTLEVDYIKIYSI
ncbi:unnamed protein product [Diamesa hyperborea]